MKLCNQWPKKAPRYSTLPSATAARSFVLRKRCAKTRRARANHFLTHGLLSLPRRPARVVERAGPARTRLAVTDAHKWIGVTALALNVMLGLTGLWFFWHIAEHELFDSTKSRSRPSTSRAWRALKRWLRPRAASSRAPNSLGFSFPNAGEPAVGFIPRIQLRTLIC